MARYLDPKNDLIFKRIFGEHKHLCISLLNSLLPLEAPVVSIEYEPSELVPEVMQKKNSIVDVRCKDANGRKFIVEMQMYWSDTFKTRVLFNASKVYVKQLVTGQDYKFLCPVYSLNLVNKIFEHDMPNTYYHHYKIVNLYNTEKQIPGLEFVFVELPKFKAQSFSEKKLQVLWLRFLTEIAESTREVPESLSSNKDIAEALSYAEQSAYTEGELNTYDKVLDIIRTESTIYSDMHEAGKREGEAERAQLQQALAAEQEKAAAQATALAAEKAEKTAALARIAQLEKLLPKSQN
ncbi:hypothetical protein AGMMS4956_21510 [Bacteroidia bacterium]|nr:hypothetical protein AGMMS4956_21510 [Bacteroidia bacterium]